MFLGTVFVLPVLLCGRSRGEVLHFLTEQARVHAEARCFSVCVASASVGFFSFSVFLVSPFESFCQAFEELNRLQQDFEEPETQSTLVVD